MESRLAQCAALGQKDKAQAYISVLSDIFSRQDDNQAAQDIHSLVDHIVHQDSSTHVAGRQVLSELAKLLGGGAIKDDDLRKAVVNDSIELIKSRISYEDPVRDHHLLGP